MLHSGKVDGGGGWREGARATAAGWQTPRSSKMEIFKEPM